MDYKSAVIGLLMSISIYAQFSNYVFKKINTSDNVHCNHYKKLAENAKKMYDLGTDEINKEKGIRVKNLFEKKMNTEEFENELRKIENWYEDTLKRIEEWKNIELKYNYYERLYDSKRPVLKGLQTVIKKTLQIENENYLYYPVWLRTWFIKNDIDAELFYEKEYTDSKLKTLKNNSLFITPDDEPSIALYSELYADYFRYIRLSIGIQVADTKEDTNKTNEKTNELTADEMSVISNGNLSFNISYPFLYVNFNNFKFITFLIAKASSDIPELGTISEHVVIRANLGIDYGL